MENERDIKDILQDHERRLSDLEIIFKKGEPRDFQKNVSPKEFLLSKKAKGGVQKTLLLGYYLEKHNGLVTFNAKDLEAVFREAKEPVPDNINLSIIRNIQKGRMMEAKDKKENFKAWTLTSLGEKAVESNAAEDHQE